MSEAERASRRVWLLTDDRPGNRSQAIGAARALGLPFEEKRLIFNGRAKLPAPLLGATLATLDEASRATIAAPWPDLVIGAGRRVAPVARFVKEAGGAKVALIGRRTPGTFADLVVRCAYFTQTADPGLLEVVLPPTKVDAEALSAAASGRDPFEGLPRPRCVALVGGPTGRHLFSDAFAGRLGRDLASAAGRSGVALAILTSRRTPASAVEALRKAAPQALLVPWRPDAPADLVLAALAHADVIAVTGESESMLAEAAATGKPLTILPLDEKPGGFQQRLFDRVGAMALGGGPLAACARGAMRYGWVAPRRDLKVLHAMIEAKGWGRVFDGELNRDAPEPRDEGRLVRDRLAALLGAQR